ncbi:MAG: Hint domain-containing protein, partial [Pseudomonadota bacterium]|nr:Hint domain-containing protein [Pseudomonadota bacterium]
VVTNYDGLVGYLPYPTAAAPPCFGPGTRIDTADGPVPVEQLRVGMMLAMVGGGFAPLRLCLSSPRWTAGPDRASPVRIAAGVLGKGMPVEELILSPQHRVWVSELGGLVPAKALTVLPGVTHAHDIAWIDYHHLVLDKHALLLANGLPCESLWPGEIALAGLPERAVRRIRAIMGPDPRPAGRFLTVAEARRGFARVGLTPSRSG